MATPPYTGLNNYYLGINVETGMATDVDAEGTPTLSQPDMNYRDARWSVQHRLYDEWIALNDARDLTSDLINLPGIKDGKQPFKDDWFGVYPYRRRPRRLYPDQI